MITNPNEMCYRKGEREVCVKLLTLIFGHDNAQKRERGED